MRIYVASSWRNTYQPGVVTRLREMKHDVYDFRNPAPGKGGFSWREIDPNWKNWTPKEYALALDHYIAKEGFDLDMEGLTSAELCVLVLPSGRSASWEYGYHCGMTDHPGIVYMPEACEPELMYRGSIFASNLEDLDEAVRTYEDAIKLLKEI